MDTNLSRCGWTSLADIIPSTPLLWWYHIHSPVLCILSFPPFFYFYFIFLISPLSLSSAMQQHALQNWSLWVIWFTSLLVDRNHSQSMDPDSSNNIPAVTMECSSAMSGVRRRIFCRWKVAGVWKGTERMSPTPLHPTHQGSVRRRSIGICRTNTSTTRWSWFPQFATVLFRSTEYTSPSPCFRLS